MFTPNEQAILDCLKVEGSTDSASIARRAGIARSSAHLALQRLVDMGIVTMDKQRGRTLYTTATREAIERAIERMAADFRAAVAGAEPMGDKPTLVFTDNYRLPDVQLRELGRRFNVVTYPTIDGWISNELFMERSLGADVIVRFDDSPVDRAFLQRVPELKAIVCPNCFPIDLDFEACEEFGVLVKHADPESQRYFSSTHVEYVVGAVLELVRPLRTPIDVLRQGWTRAAPDDLYGKRVGLVAGSWGVSALTDVFRSLGCEVNVSNTAASPPSVADFGLTGYQGLEDLWEWADIVVFIDGASADVDALLASRPTSPRFLVVMSSHMTFSLEVAEQRVLDGTLAGLALDLSTSMRTAVTSETFERLANYPNVVVTPESGVISKRSLARSHQQTFDMLASLPPFR